MPFVFTVIQIIVDNVQVNEDGGSALVFVVLLNAIERIVVLNYTTEGTEDGATGVSLTLGAHAQQGVCHSVRPSVCPVPLILPLRATRRPNSNTNGFSTTLS